MDSFSNFTELPLKLFFSIVQIYGSYIFEIFSFPTIPTDSIWIFFGLC